MSKIYDALAQAAKKSDSSTAVFRSSIDRKTELPNLSSRAISLQWKIIGAVVTVLLAFGLVLVIIANQHIGRTLRTEIDQRALAIATNLSDAAAAPVISKNILDLYALLTKYARLQGVAYAFIEDNNGQIVAHSMRPFPSELMGTLTPDERKQVGTRVVTLQGNTVYETRVPVLEGQLGAAHLGIWAEGVKTQINAVLLPFVGLIALVLLVAVALSVFLVRAIITPIGGRTDKTTDVSAGELNAPVENRVAR
jgi:sensor histidine kinase regulating citrate/malate metabolism